MSGIAAIINFSGKPVERAEIASMIAAMPYRGPDGIRHWVSGHVAMGACEMHTVAGSKDAPQPWHNEDHSVVIVLDGYVGNHEELARELKERGTRLRNTSDVELVLRSYEMWGEQCPAKIEGQFAFVIWDAGSRIAFCARDHQGLCPLFYSRRDDRLILASDFAALREVLGDVPKPNENVLIQLAANHCCFREETIWSGIKRIMPAHSLSFSQSGDREERYWHLPQPYSIRHENDDDYAEHYREVLIGAVQRASRTHMDAGYEVSGGLDSSAVFSIANLLDERGDLPAPAMAGYTLAGPKGSEADEVQYSAAVGQFLGRDIHRAELSTPDMDWFSDGAERNMDLSYYPNSAMALGMYRAMAAKGCRIAVNGLGGDEWLNGNPQLFHQSLVARDWKLFARSIRSVQSDFGTANATRALGRFGLLPLASRPVKSLITSLSGKRPYRKPPATPWLSANARERLEEASRHYERRLFEESQGDERYRLLDLPMRTLIMEHASRMRSQCGIEGRHPLSSRAFIEFSAATPTAIRLRGREQKFLHRKALKSDLPNTVRKRKSKAEFGIVIEAHRSAAAQLLKHGMHEELGAHIDKDGLQDLLLAAQERRIDTDWKWPLCSIVSVNHVYMSLIR